MNLLELILAWQAQVPAEHAPVFQQTEEPQNLVEVIGQYQYDHHIQKFDWL